MVLMINDEIAAGTTQIDQDFNPNSEAAQSGKAVNNALTEQRADLPRYPDYANQIIFPSGTTEWTATEDCYASFMVTTNGEVAFYINNKNVSITDGLGNQYNMTLFNGYIKKGDVVRCANLPYSNRVKIFKLTT